ncbi:hypothetical protein NIES2098_32510 [Calothrix sp. NIES-2098]|nr:hypothetical protein NIES2098_32510 [Calothrix sp. NIES-2098]
MNPNRKVVKGLVDDSYLWRSDVCLEKFRSAEAAAPTFRYDGLRLRVQSTHFVTSIQPVILSTSAKIEN